MFSFFRRQKTTDSDKDGKGDKDKKDGKGKEKHTLSSSPGTSKKGDGQDKGKIKEKETEISRPVTFKNGRVESERKDGEKGPTTSTTPTTNGDGATMKETPIGVAPNSDTGVQSELDFWATPPTSRTFGAAPTLVVAPPAPPAARRSLAAPAPRIGVQSECDLWATPPTRPRTVGAAPTLGVAPPAPLAARSSFATPAPRISSIKSADNSDVADKLDKETGAILLHSPGVSSRNEVEREKDSEDEEKRNLVNQEARFQEQLAELNAKLTAREAETNTLTYKMEEMQRDVQVKTWGMDRLQAELSAAHKESECVRQKLRKMEDDVTEYRQKNQELSEELLKKADAVASVDSSHSERVVQLEASVKDLEAKLKELEKELVEIRVERDQLEEERAEMEAEREEEMKIVQEALEETQEEKDEIQARFEKDFERLRTVNTDREQQLLNDFEWKLREVEQACKKRLEEKDKKAEEKLSKCQAEMADKVKEAEKQMKEAQHLKKYEAEATQLREVTHEQLRSLRTSQRQKEQLQVSELMLKEEVSRLRAAVDSEKNSVQALQIINEKKVSDLEKKLHNRLDQQKSEMNAQWEERLRRDCSRLKTELDKLHAEEKQLALESLKVQTEQEMRTVKQSLERKLLDSMNEVSKLNNILTEKDAFYQKELERAQTNADRDVLELRRKLDKLDMSYQEQIEKLKERHEREMEQLNWEAGRKIQQVEQNWQLQTSSTRTTLELVKEQMERDTQDRLEALDAKHREKLEEQWDLLTREKETEMEQLEEAHQKELEKIKEEFQLAFKSRSSREGEMVQKVAALEAKLRGQCAVIGDLQGNADLLQGSVQVLNDQIISQGKEVQRVQTQAAQNIRERELQLGAEWELQLVALKEQHDLEVQQCHADHAAAQNQLINKINSLTKLFDDSCEKQKSNQSLPEDIRRITDLTNMLAERDQELSSLTEEKRFYQLELINRETTYNQIFRSQPVVGIIDPLQYLNGPRKKGGGKGNTNPHQPTPPRPIQKSPRKHKKVGGNMTPAQVSRSKSLDFKPQTKHKSRHMLSNTVTQPSDENLTISTL